METVTQPFSGFVCVVPDSLSVSALGGGERLGPPGCADDRPAASSPECSGISDRCLGLFREPSPSPASMYSPVPIRRLRGAMPPRHRHRNQHSGRTARRRVCHFLRGVPVSRPQRGHAALTARLDPVVHRVDTRARLSGGLPLLHAAKHKLDGFAPCSRRDDGLPHTLSITGVGHRPVFQTLSGRIAEALDHFSGHHRGREIWFHRPFSFLGTEHN